jgi:hypothetical protein
VAAVVERQVRLHSEATAGRRTDGERPAVDLDALAHPNQPQALILRTAGTNCDEETAYAFELAGATPRRVHLNRILEQPGESVRCIAAYHVGELGLLSLRPRLLDDACRGIPRREVPQAAVSVDQDAG